MRKRQHGFSIVELLVVLAIIAILMALYLPILGRVMGKAKDVAAKEGLRQGYLGDAADNANSAGRRDGPLPNREACRKAFRSVVNTGKDEAIYTKMLYVVTSDEEFEAYWHTIINPDASGPLDFEGREVFVQTPSGSGFFLPVIEALDVVKSEFGNVPVAWTYISTHLADTSTGSIGGEVLYSDGNVQHVRYPGPFPMTRTVAELSREFLHPTEPVVP